MHVTLHTRNMRQDEVMDCNIRELIEHRAVQNIRHLTHDTTPHILTAGYKALDNGVIEASRNDIAFLHLTSILSNTKRQTSIIAEDATL